MRRRPRRRPPARCLGPSRLLASILVCARGKRLPYLGGVRPPRQSSFSSSTCTDLQGFDRALRDSPVAADEAADKETLEQAIRAAVADIATHAVAFTPTIVSLLETKLVGDRIYLLVLLADAAGEAEIFEIESTQPGLQPR